MLLHHGNIEARNTAGGGTHFLMTLRLFGFLY